MAIVLSIANQKGGVGKTTTAGVLAYLLDQAGYKVLAVDMDMQSNLSELLTQTDVDNLLESHHVKGTVLEAMIVEDPRRYILKKACSHIDLLISNDELAQITAYLYSDEYHGHVSECLKKTLSKVQEQYDFIVIDTPPSLSELMTNALGASDFTLIPFDTSRYGLTALDRIFTTLSKIKENVNPRLKVLGIVPALIDSKRKDSRQVMDMLREHPVYSKYLIPTQILRRAAIGRLSLFGFEENKEFLEAVDFYLPILEELIERGQERSASR
jgi:chromosome partitioning protein